jgi:hypothetical protein
LEVENFEAKSMAYMPQRKFDEVVKPLCTMSSSNLEENGVKDFCHNSGCTLAPWYHGVDQKNDNYKI